jgi:hypothetical protein
MRTLTRLIPTLLFVALTTGLCWLALHELERPDLTAAQWDARIR